MASDMDVDGVEGATRRVLTAADKGKGKAVDETPSAGGAAMPWVEKYRPKSLADVAAHKDIVDTISRLTSEGRLPHLLLYGPPGTGKTSTVLAAARQLYGQAGMKRMCLELNASDERGIDVVRQQVQDFASTQSMMFGTPKSSVKLVVLDEADSMTKDAQFSLRRIMEKYTRSTRFCLICNHVSRIIPALQSRCTRFRFPPLLPADVRSRLEFVAQQESLSMSEDGLQAVVRLACGDLRRALNILQATHMSNGSITGAAVHSSTGSPTPEDIEAMALALLNDTFLPAVTKLTQLKEQRGLALIDIIRLLHEYIMRVDIPPSVRMKLLESMSDTEYRLTSGTNERLQLGALVGAFTHARHAIAATAR